MMMRWLLHVKNLRKFFTITHDHCDEQARAHQKGQRCRVQDRRARQHGDRCAEHAHSLQNTDCCQEQARAVDCEQCTMQRDCCRNPGVREIVTIRGLGVSGTLFFCNDLCLHNYEEARKRMNMKAAAVLAQTLVQTLVTPRSFIYKLLILKNNYNIMSWAA